MRGGERERRGIERGGRVIERVREKGGRRERVREIQRERERELRTQNFITQGLRF